MWDLAKFNNKTAVITDNGEEYTYHDLAAETDKLAYQIKNRCLVIILCTNTIGCLIGYVSCIRKKIVPMMLDSNMDMESLDHIIEKYRPKYLWIPKAQAGFEKYNTAYQDKNYKLIELHYAEDNRLYSELALLLSTSGSTGSIKFVRQSYENIKANTYSIAKYLKIDSNDAAITILPMHYTYGLSIINTHLYAGAVILLTAMSIVQRQFWNFFNSNNGTSISGVPYTYEILKKLNFSKLPQPSLKTITQAGGKISQDINKYLVDYAKEQKCKLFIMYGQTEATARISYLPYDKAESKRGSIGIAIPGGKMALADINGIEIEMPNEVGEIVYTGDNVALGYAYDYRDLIKGDEWNKRLMTGDLGYRDEEGYYYITGRKDRFVKIFGNRLSLDELESTLYQEYQEEIICILKDNVIYMFTTDDQIKDLIPKFISMKTGINMNGFCVKIVSGIPKTSAGKISYSALVEMLMEDLD